MFARTLCLVRLTVFSFARLASSLSKPVFQVEFFVYHHQEHVQIQHHGLEPSDQSYPVCLKIEYNPARTSDVFVFLQ